MTPSDYPPARTYNPAMDPAVPLTLRWPRIGRSPHDAEIPLIGAGDQNYLALAGLVTGATRR